MTECDGFGVDDRLDREGRLELNSGERLLDFNDHQDNNEDPTRFAVDKRCVKDPERMDVCEERIPGPNIDCVDHKDTLGSTADCETKVDKFHKARFCKRIGRGSELWASNEEIITKDFSETKKFNMDQNDEQRRETGQYKVTPGEFKRDEMQVSEGVGGSSAVEAEVAKLEANNTDMFGRTPLHLAAEQGLEAVCRQLLQNGADANVRNVIGQTALSMAAVAGHVDVCRLLVDVTDDINGIDRYGNTALDATGSPGVCGVLLGACADISRPLGHVPQRVVVLEEAFSGCLAGVRYLVEVLGADVNQRDHLSDQSPIHRAAKAGKADICEYLLTHQAAPHAADCLGNTPLHLASTADTAQCLIKSGAVVNQKNKAEELPLHTTALHNCARLTQLVIDATDVMTPNVRGETALHIAARAGAYHVARTLILRMDDVNCRDALGNMALHVLRGDASEICRELVKAGATVDEVNTAGDTAALAAARGGGRELVDTLIELGADINLANHRAETPLHVAVAGGHRGVAEVLVASVADVELRDADGRTPLHLTTNTFPVFLPSVCRALVARGACVDAVDSAGLTPLAAAVKANHVEACETLLRLGADPNKRLDRCHLPGARCNTPGASSSTSSGTGDRRQQDRAPALFLSTSAPIMTLLLQHGAQLGLRVTVWHESAGGLVLKGSIPGHCTRRHCLSYTHLDLLLHGLSNSCLDAGMQAYTLLDLYMALDARCVWQASCIVRESNNKSGVLGFMGAKRADRLQRLLTAGGSVSGLRALCRAVVRGALMGAGRPGRSSWRGPGIAARIHELPLPTAIQNYLMLPELNDLLVTGCCDVAVSKRVVGALAV